MRYRIVVFSLLLTFLIAVSSVQGQEQPLVGFVVTNTLNTASLSDPGPDGLTTLAQAFARQGARPQILRLDEPIADEVQVVVLVGPTRTLSMSNLAYLWEYLTRGHNLLLALDPNGYQRVGTERSTGGLNQLLRLEYGTQFDDNLLIQPWFLKAGLDDLRTNQIAALPDSFVPHPILEPLANFQLPVHIWGGRSVQVEPFGPDLSSAYPLIFVETAYGETSNRLFVPEDADPLEFDIASDAQGRLLLGGIGVNEVMGSRVAVLGDSEMLQNGFGLARLPGTETPRYPGNQVLTDRLVAWLLERPEDDWPALPNGFTWLQIDGDPGDWDPGLPAVTNASPETASPGYAIERVVATRNDAYVYLLIETTQPSAPLTEVAIVANNNEQMIDLQLSATAVMASTESEPLPDGALAVGEVIEVRLPERGGGLIATHRGTLPRKSSGYIAARVFESSFLDPVVELG